MIRKPSEVLKKSRAVTGYSNYFSDAMLKIMEWMRSRKINNKMCINCINGHINLCEYPETCPCVCNETDFPLNKIRNRG